MNEDAALAKEDEFDQFDPFESQISLRNFLMKEFKIEISRATMYAWYKQDCPRRRRGSKTVIPPDMVNVILHLDSIGYPLTRNDVTGLASALIRDQQGNSTMSELVALSLLILSAVVS